MRLKPNDEPCEGSIKQNNQLTTWIFNMFFVKLNSNYKEPRTAKPRSCACTSFKWIKHPVPFHSHEWKKCNFWDYWKETSYIYFRKIALFNIKPWPDHILKRSSLPLKTSPIASSTSATVPPIVVKFLNMKDRNSILKLASHVG